MQERGFFQEKQLKMSDKRIILFSEAQIKSAFWEEFHEAGELWFDYLGNEKDSEDSTNGYWQDFLLVLKRQLYDGSKND